MFRCFWMRKTHPLRVSDGKFNLTKDTNLSGLCIVINSRSFGSVRSLLKSCKLQLMQRVWPNKQRVMPQEFWVLVDIRSHETAYHRYAPRWDKTIQCCIKNLREKSCNMIRRNPTDMKPIVSKARDEITTETPYCNPKHWKIKLAKLAVSGEKSPR